MFAVAVIHPHPSPRIKHDRIEALFFQGEEKLKHF